MQTPLTSSLQGKGSVTKPPCCLLLFSFLSLKAWSPGEGMNEQEPLLHWLKATTHTTRCTPSAVCFVIKVSSPHRKAEHWVSVLPLKKECLREALAWQRVSLWCRVWIFSLSPHDQQLTDASSLDPCTLVATEVFWLAFLLVPHSIAGDVVGLTVQIHSGAPQSPLSGSTHILAVSVLPARQCWSESHSLESHSEGSHFLGQFEGFMMKSDLEAWLVFPG